MRTITYIKRWLKLGRQEPMPFTQLVSELCRREKGKRQVDAVQMSEIVKCLKEIIKENESIAGNRVIELLRK